MPSELLIQYSTSTAFASGIIRRLCHSPFSHVDIVIPGEGLLGASGPGHYKVRGQLIEDLGGVRLRPFEPWEYAHPPKVAHIKAPDEAVFRTIATWKGQIGKPFDNTALWDFLSDDVCARNWRDPEKWFCSEGVVWAAEKGGVFPWPLVVQKNRVSPADSLLLFNPLMTEDSIKDFQV